MKTFKEYADDKTDRIGRYIMYIAQTRDIPLEEAARRSLAHIFNLVTTSPNPIVSMTAFRSEENLSTNRMKNIELEADFRRLGWGYTPVLGGFIERIRKDGVETGETRKVDNEESYFAVASMAGTNNKQFLAQVQTLVEKYQQEAALVKMPDDNSAYFLNAGGELKRVGSWSLNKMADYFTKMRKGPPDRQFAFEAAADLSYFTRMSVDKYFEIVDKYFEING